MTFVVSSITPDQGTTQLTRTNGIRRSVYRGMADSASYTACGQRAATQLPKDTAEHGLTSRLWPPNSRRRSHSLKTKAKMTSGCHRPGRIETPCEMERREPGLADGRLNRNLAGWVRLRPVIRMFHWPGQARLARLGLAVPHWRDLAPPVKNRWV